MSVAPTSQTRGTVSASASTGRFLAALADDVTRETARVVAMQLGWRDPEVRSGGAETLPALIEDASIPSLLLADISDSADPLAAMDALAAQCGPQTRVVVVGLVNDVGLYRRLIAMGVSDYLLKPVSATVLAEAIQAATLAPPSEPDSPKTAPLVALIGARGGVGATSLTLSAAAILARERRVVVLDLDLHFGSVALSLDLEPGPGLHEMLSNPERIDSLLIGSATTSAGDRLRILGGEDPLEERLTGGHEGLATLLADLSHGADCIVVDTPRSLDDLGRHVLAVADVIAIVTDHSLAAMRDTRRLLALARNQRPGNRVLAIANRVGGVPGEVSRADFERGIGEKIDVSIPYDAKAALAAAERGKPLAEVARAPATLAALRSLADSLTGGRPSPPKARLVDRLLGK